MKTIGDAIMLRIPDPGEAILLGLHITHGLMLGQDLWQHRRQFVANMRWWPPFCVVVDWIAAAIIAVAIVSGVDLQ